MIVITRLLEFDAGHRLMNHESKCKHAHGHRYKVEVSCTAAGLDKAGRIIDFGVVKQIVGGWIDTAWDHAFIVNAKDMSMRVFLEDNAQKHFVLESEPSAENMATFLLIKASELLKGTGVTVLSVKIWETPNCYAVASVDGVVMIDDEEPELDKNELGPEDLARAFEETSDG